MRFVAPDMTALWHGAAASLFFDPKPDFVSSSDVIAYDSELHARSMAFDFDAGRDLFLGAARFTKLQRDYLDPIELKSFLERCEKIGRKDNNRGVVTQMPPASHSRAVGRYQWGNCIIGWTFRGGGRHTPVLSMHSRTSYVSYMGGMDLALCAVLARYIADRIEWDKEEIEFRWKADSLMFHDFKSIPYVLQRDALRAMVKGEESSLFPYNEYPCIKKIAKTFAWMRRQDEAGVEWHEEKFGPRKRIRRRYHEWQQGIVHPPVPLADLDLTPEFQLAIEEE